MPTLPSVTNSGSLFLHVYFCFVVVSVHLSVSIFVAVLFISTTNVFPRYGAIVVLKPADVDISCFRYFKFLYLCHTSIHWVIKVMYHLPFGGFLNSFIFVPYKFTLGD